MTGPQLYSLGKPSGICVQYKWNPHLAGKRFDVLNASDTILAYDYAPLHRSGRNCCFADGHVRWLPEDRFRTRLRQSGIGEVSDGSE